MLWNNVTKPCSKKHNLPDQLIEFSSSPGWSMGCRRQWNFVENNKWRKDLDSGQSRRQHCCKSLLCEVSHILPPLFTKISSLWSEHVLPHLFTKTHWSYSVLIAKEKSSLMTSIICLFLKWAGFRLVVKWS